MKEIKRLFISLLATVFLMFISAYYHTSIECSFTVAIRMFSFNILGTLPTILFILLISILIPITAMIILFGQLYSSPEYKPNFISDVIIKHIYFGHLLMCIIYTIDILYDWSHRGVAAEYNTYYNGWHKYILHLIIGPVLFLDAIYSIEIEKIRTDDEVEAKRFDPVYYYAAQVFFSAYLVYILGVILFLNDDKSLKFESTVPTIVDLKKASEIFGYVTYVVDDIIMCVFAALFMGLFDQDISLIHGLMVFEIYTDWTHEKLSKYARRLRRKSN